MHIIFNGDDIMSKDYEQSWVNKIRVKDSKQSWVTGEYVWLKNC